MSSSLTPWPIVDADEAVLDMSARVGRRYILDQILHDVALFAYGGRFFLAVRIYQGNARIVEHQAHDLWKARETSYEELLVLLQQPGRRMHAPFVLHAFMERDSCESNLSREEMISILGWNPLEKRAKVE